MKGKLKTSNRYIYLSLYLLILLGISACSQANVQAESPSILTPSPTATLFSPRISQPTPVPELETDQVSMPQTALKPSPTPDQLREPPVLRTWNEIHMVSEGDELMQIARQYEVGVQQILTANGRERSAPLHTGQALIIPNPIPENPPPYFKMFPDSELVYGPSLITSPYMDATFPADQPISNYIEIIDGISLDGSEIIQRVAEKYSVNPKLLVALVIFQCAQIQDNDSCLEDNDYPLGWNEPGKEGLYHQLSWAADQLNFGFYRWLSGWNGPFIFPDGRVMIPTPGINAGTAAVQYLFSRLYPVEVWRQVVSEEGFYPTYFSIFGNPFELAFEPLLPADLTQPVMDLPFEPGVPWSFTGGPHSAIGNWAAWGALDFAPSLSASGCKASEDWVVAVADGEITRSYNGQVMQELDGDGFEQTGWAVLYFHIATEDRVQAGTYLHQGERIGHPSCEGGFSTGTHLHLARKYNGVWISADGEIPFNLNGWVSSSEGAPYDGSMNRGGTELRACAWWRSCEITTYWGIFDNSSGYSQSNSVTPEATSLFSELTHSEEDSAPTAN
jgi:LasA protease